MPRGIPNTPRTPGDVKPAADLPNSLTADARMTPSEAGAIDTSGISPVTVANRVVEEVARAEAKVAGKVTEPLDGTVEQQLAAARSEAKELRALVEELKGSIAPLAKIAAEKSAATVQTPAKVKLPTEAEAQADADARVERGEPVHPVLTDKGHFVHPLSGYQPERGAQMSVKDVQKLVTTLVQAQQAASNTAAQLSRAKTADMMSEGKLEKVED